MRRNKRKQNNIIIAGLLSIVLLMVVGYAAFASKLNIKGTSNITSNWNVEITGITKDKTSGNVTEINAPAYTKDSATFNVGLESPSDYIYYKIAVTNKGSLAAIAKIGNLDCGNGSVIECGAYPDSSLSTNIENNTTLEESRLIIGPNETEYYNIYIKYNSEITIQPNITNQNIKLTLTYNQSDVGITHKTEDNCYTGKVLKDGTMSITNYNEECGTDVVIPEQIDGYTVTEIADGTYDDNLGTIGPFSKKGITSVTMSNTITYIGAFSFNTNKIKTVNLSSNLKEIGHEAFTNNQIANIYLPNSLTKINTCAFMNNKLTSISIPNSVTYLGDGAFGMNKMSDDVFIYNRNSDGSIDYTTLNSYAGENKNPTIPQNITSIGKMAFRGFNGNSITIPSTVKTISQYAFFNSSIVTVNIEDGVENIGNSAFFGSKLTEINIPNSVETIGTNAFEKSYLNKVAIGSGIKTIGTNAFKTEPNYNPIETITINKKEGSLTGSPWGATTAKITYTSPD